MMTGASFASWLRGAIDRPSERSTLASEAVTPEGPPKKMFCALTLCNSGKGFSIWTYILTSFLELLQVENTARAFNAGLCLCLCLC